MNDNAANDLRLYAIPDIHGHAKGEHKAFSDERPIPLSARMLFLWFYHACRRGWPRFLMVSDHMNYLTFEDPAAINLVRRALKLAQAGDLYGAAETASVEVGHAAVVSEGLRRGMRYSIGAEVDNDPRSRPDAQNIVDAMKPDGMIRSVHFVTVDHPVHGPNWNWPFDNPEFRDVYDVVGTAKTWELYMATLLDAVERLPGQIVGHFYVPATFGHWPDNAVLESYEDQIVAACEARGMAIELNTRFLYRNHPDEEKAKYLVAYRRLLAKCKASNVGVAVGSDAHSPKDQGRGFDTILALLDECEINELVFPIAGRLARVALRVERKNDTLPATESPVAPIAEDRKAVRKARTSEVPARSKDVSSKRDEASASESTALTDQPTPAKSKSRPKRSKNRAAAPADGELDEAPTGDDVAVDDVSVARPDAAGFTEPASVTVSPGAPDAADATAATSGLRGTDAAEQTETTPGAGDPEEIEPSDVAAAPSEPPEAHLAEPAVHAPSQLDPDEPAADAAAHAGEQSAGMHVGNAETPTDRRPNGLAIPVLDGEANAQTGADFGDSTIDEGVLVEMTAELVTEARTESVFEPIVSTEGIVTTPQESADDDIADESYGIEDRVAFTLVPGGETDAPDANSGHPVPRPARSTPARVPVVSSKTTAPKSRAVAAAKAKAPAKTKAAPKKSAKPALKPAAKKATAKAAAGKKVALKATVVKKAAAKKAPSKKAATRPSGVKKAGAKKAAKRTSAKKPAPKRR